MTIRQVKTSTKPSLKDEWRTPAMCWGVERESALFDILNAEFHFDVDAAADWLNTLCDDWIGPVEDALSIDWVDARGPVTFFCNPPFSRKGEFLQQGRVAALKGATCVFIVPGGNQETMWFSNAVTGNADVFRCPDVEVRNLIGRVKYIDTRGILQPSPDFPSAVIVMRPGLIGGGVWWWDWRRTTY